MYLWLGHRKKSPKQNNKCEMQEENNMCRKLVVTNQIFLGTRAICYEAYSLPKGEVVELTEKQIKDALKGITTDEVYGLALSDAGELVLDTDNFYAVNMMKKIHTNTLLPMLEEDCLANLFYIVIGTHKEKGNTMYDVSSSRYERTSFTEEKVKTLLDMHIISPGARLTNGVIEVAPLEKPKAVAETGCGAVVSKVFKNKIFSNILMYIFYKWFTNFLEIFITNIIIYPNHN